LTRGDLVAFKIAKKDAKQRIELLAGLPWEIVYRNLKNQRLINKLPVITRVMLFLYFNL
jgi:hypothetical protein